MPESDLADIVGGVCDHRRRTARLFDTPEAPPAAVIGTPVATLVGNASSSGFEQEKPDWGRSSPLGRRPSAQSSRDKEASTCQ